MYMLVPLNSTVICHWNMVVACLSCSGIYSRIASTMREMANAKNGIY